MSDLPSQPAKVAGLSATNLTFRVETPADAPWVNELQARAFGPGRFARAAFRVREMLPIDPDLSLIAEIDGKPVSSVWMTPISLIGSNGYLLGPLATDPTYRNLGAGKLLVREASRMAMSEKGAGYVLLVGDPPYYSPLGFAPTRPGAIRFPGPVDPARVLVHSGDETLAARLEGNVAAPVS